MQLEQHIEVAHDHCTHEDVQASIGFVARLYKEAQVSPEVENDNIQHSAVVREYALAIAKAHHLDEAFMGVAGQCHDCGKLDKQKPGEIDTWAHHQTSARATNKFLQEERGKTPVLGDRMERVIQCHSYIPFIRDFYTQQYEKMVAAGRGDGKTLEQYLEAVLPEPKTSEELALRDADMLAMIDVMAGLRKIVNIRQKQGSPWHEAEKDNIGLSIASAMQSAHTAYSILHFDYAQQIGEKLHSRVVVFQNAFAHSQVQTLETFLQFCDDWVAKEKTQELPIAA